MRAGLQRALRFVQSPGLRYACTATGSGKTPFDRDCGGTDGVGHDGARVAASGSLTVGLGTDVTAIDPHYHNLTPNNNVAAHIFGYLVERNEKSQPSPASRPNGRRSIRRRGSSSCAKASSFTTAATSPRPTSSRRSSACRRCRTARRRSPRYTKQIKKIDVVDPLHDPVQDRDAVSADAVRHDAGRDHSKAVAKASTDDFKAGKAAIGTGPYKLVRYAKGDRIELARNDAWWGGKTPWEKVTLRLLPQDASRVAALLSGDVQVIENVPTSDVAQAQDRTSASRSTAPSPTG